MTIKKTTPRLEPAIKKRATEIPIRIIYILGESISRGCAQVLLIYYSYFIASTRDRVSSPRACRCRDEVSAISGINFGTRETVAICAIKFSTCVAQSIQHRNYSNIAITLQYCRNVVAMFCAVCERWETSGREIPASKRTDRKCRWSETPHISARKEAES